MSGNLDSPRSSDPPSQTGAAPTERTPRCLDCYYILTGLCDSRCPECGRPFDPGDPSTFTCKPPFVWWRLWLPAWLLAVGCGALTTLVLLPLGSPGFGATVAVPVMIGAIVGYRSRIGRVRAFGLALSAVVGVVALLLSMSVVGLLCGLMSLLLYWVTVGLGAWAGLLLRNALKRSQFSQRAYLPVLIGVAVTIAGGAAEQWFGWRAGAETCATSEMVDATPDELWQRMAFYEEVPGPRPWLLRVAGPVPVRTIRDSDGVTRTCVYEHGQIKKRMTIVDAPQHLAFDVVAQNVGEERAVRLLDGSFRFEAAPDGKTLVTLTTRYEPLLRPRILWRPLEQLVCGAVHAHVMTGLQTRRDETPGLASGANGVACSDAQSDAP